MWTELRTIVQTVSEDPQCLVTVLTSAIDKGFTAGLDLKSQIELQRHEHDPARKAYTLRQHLLDFQGAISSLSKCRQPVIVAMHGLCLGLAVDIASACDVRIAAEDASFGIMEIDVGLAADIGTLQRFPKIIGNDSLARELSYTGRRFSAKEAKEMGFLSEVVKGSKTEVVSKAMEIAKMIASKSPIALMSTKHLLNHARDHTVEEGLKYTAIWNAAMLQASVCPQSRCWS
ncbi:hypothetical protein TREMEDRAFT_37467 [Tremella mesenterica DSM 1558]|uniref:uncharacterized protein n=1 Tax=Tremella mesenterica (strain ATCC 24925 / CBS 8224 / DSM 1558 / NBRC 9311 / NRRL Y-6157 / RJB 2259-6 / UBC 559-6) TaxID=578456 RepID=UPI0003F491EF|nr:uncharacterized protein TREMEDRAFT_37467 [Tremella mesenterica DSM 1558]EIW73689.1 hypothetical protein TREMEDRAFT_37467 [Tremella mesenterica DSM 1558]